MSTPHVALTSSATAMTTPLLVTKGWSVFDSYRGQPRGRYAPCATIPWAYEPAGQPATAGGMSKDIAATFQLLTQVTGLTFVRADHVTKPGIAFRWDDMSDTGFACSRDGMPGRNWLLVHSCTCSATTV